MNWQRLWFGPLREEAGDAGADGGGSGAPNGGDSTPIESGPASHFDDVIDNYLGREAAEAPPKPTAVEPVAPAPNMPVTAPPAGTQAAGPGTPAPSVPVAVTAQVPQQAAPATVTAQPPAFSQSQSQPTQADPTQRWQAARQAAVGDFERSLSNFSEQDVVTLMTEPHKVLPKFGAELGMAVFDMTLRSVMTMLPQVIAAHQNHGRAEEQAHEQFYGMYPQLRQHPQGIETLYRVGPAYNQANAGRQIEPSTRMREIGEIVCRSLGIDPSPQNVQAAAAGVAASGTPGQPQPSPVPILPPHSPAGLGGAAAPPSVREQMPWDDVLHLARR